MHIAFLTPEYPHDKINHSGGMGTSIKNLANALIKRGHEATIFIYGQNKSETFNENGINFHLIAQRKYRFGGFYFYRKYLERYLNDNSENIDVIEAPDWTGITAFMNLSKPVMIRLHGSDTYFCHIENRVQKKKNHFFEQNAIDKASAYIAPTHFAGKISMDLFNKSMKQLQVIPNGLDLTQFHNDDITDYKPFTLLNIGTIIRKKGVFQLIEIFEKILKTYPKAQLLFIGGDSNDVKTGSSSTWELLQSNFSDKAKEQIKYLGKVPYKQVQEHIKNAHICVFPSLAETLGMVTIESMALGKAVVNTDIGWAQDLIEHEVDGYMHHPNDIESYIETISMLFNNEKELLRVGVNAVKSVSEKFDINIIVDKNIQFYQSILNK